MKLAITTGLVIALASPLFAENQAAAPKEKKEKISYSIGADIGSSLKEQKELGLDYNFLSQGFRDALDGKLTLSEEERNGVLQEFQKEMQAKMLEKQKEFEAEEKKKGEANKAASEKFLEENKKKDGVKVTASGLQYKEGTTGTGAKPTAQDVVKVHYKGTLIDGKEFDSSYKRNEPVEFPLGQVIPGWTEGLQLMPVGSKWTLYLPSTLAYGEQAPPDIGPNQALIFEVELLDIVKKEEAPAEGDAKKEEKKD